MKKIFVFLSLLILAVLISGCLSTNKLTVTFDLGGGLMPEGTPTVITNISKGDSIALPIPTKEGFVFCGWFLGSSADDGQFTNDTVVTKDLTLYALWKEDSQLIIEFFNILDSKNYTVAYERHENLNVGSNSSGSLEHMNFQIQNHDDRKVHTYTYHEKQFLNQQNPNKTVNNWTKKSYLYEDKTGFYKFYLNSYFDRWDFKKTNEPYKPVLLKNIFDLFDINLFTKRSNVAIYDYTVTPEFLSYFPLDFADGILEYTANAYLDIDQKKLAMTIQVSGTTSSGIPLTATTDITITFSEVGTTTVIFPFDMVRSELVAYINEDTHNRKELHYTDNQSKENYFAYMDDIVDEVDTASLYRLEELYRSYQGIIGSYQLPIDPILEMRYLAKQQITNQFEQFKKTATADSVATMEEIVASAFNLIDDTTDQYAMENIVNDMIEDLQKAFVKDPIIIKKETYISYLQRIHDIYVNATNDEDKIADLEALHELYDDAIRDAADLVALEEARLTAFNAYRNFEITLEEEGLVATKISLITYVVNLHQLTIIDYQDIVYAFNQPLHDLYLQNIDELLDAQTLQAIMDVFQTFLNQYYATTLREVRALALSELEKQIAPYRAALLAVDEAVFEAKYQEVLAIINTETDFPFIIKTLTHFLYDEIVHFTYNQLLLEKGLAIAHLEYELAQFKKTATADSITNLDAAFLTHKANIEAATTIDDVNFADSQVLYVLRDAYVLDPNKDTSHIVDKLSTETSILLRAAMTMFGENITYVLLWVLHVEMVRLSLINSAEEAETLYDDLMALLQRLPLAYNQEKLLEAKDKIAAFLDEMYDEAVLNLPNLPDNFTTDYQALVLVMNNAQDFFTFSCHAAEVYRFLRIK